MVNGDMAYEIPLTETTLGEEEVEAAVRVLRSKWLTMGAEVRAFEEEFAALLGVPHAVAVTNGTAALEIVFQAVGIRPGDEVLVPAITFVACRNALVRAGATPVLVDLVSADDLTMCAEDAWHRLTPRTRAVVPMPYGGFPPAMEALSALCREQGLLLIEDACHAPLARVGGHLIGTFGVAATWSFFGNKNMTTGEGGMITTGDEALAEECRLLRSHGMTRSTWDRARGAAHDYDVVATGQNARMDEIRAAIGRVQLGKLAKATEARREAAGHLRQAIDGRAIPGLRIPFRDHRGTAAHHLFVVLLPGGADRATVRERLAADGIQTSVHYPPLDRFTATKPPEDSGAEALPVTRAVEKRLLTLPLFPGLDRMVADRIATSLEKALA